MIKLSSDFYKELLKKFPHSPTSKQRELLLLMSEFIFKKEINSLFLLKGYAGTGKNGDVDGDAVITVGTVCNGDKQMITDGKQFGTTLQSPLHEGQLAIKLVQEYMENGELANYINFTPNPSVTGATMDFTALRGFDGNLYGIDELCSGAWD